MTLAEKVAARLRGVQPISLGNAVLPALAALVEAAEVGVRRYGEYAAYDRALTALAEALGVDASGGKP